MTSAPDSDTDTDTNLDTDTDTDLNTRSNPDLDLDILHLHREHVYPPSDGGEVRVWKTADRLARFGTVWFACPTANAYVHDNGVRTVDISNPYMRRKLTRIYLWNGLLAVDPTGWFDRLQTDRTVETLMQHPASFDLVVCDSPQMIRASRRLADHFDATLLVNFHNSMYELLDQQLRSRPVPAPLRTRAVDRLRALEQAAIDAADAVVFQSPDDVSAYDLPAESVPSPESISTSEAVITSESTPRSPSTPAVAVIPNGCDYDDIAAGEPSPTLRRELALGDETVCAYVGAYDYEPNRRAARLICEEIAPELPDVTFVLAGREPPSSTPANVRAPGFVDDLSDLLATADVALCPLTMGSGTKLKMMDYLAAGLPIVTTEVGAQGIDLVDGEHALVRSAPEGFIDAIRRLETDPALRERLGSNAAALGRQYAWRTLLAGYDELLATLFGDEHDT